MKGILSGLLFAWMTIGLAGCDLSVPPILGCDSTENLKVVCGFKNPEDLALTPDGDALIVSQSGNIGLYALQGNLTILYRGKSGQKAVPGWGDASCPGSPSADFWPHGIDLDRRPDGTWQLLVVNHGGREAIEFFEVIMTGFGTEIEWKGCVEMTEDLYLNDVVSRSDGGFWATHMYSRSSRLRLYTSIMGIANGYVISWTPGGSVEKVSGTEGVFPNGIEKSEDESFLYINMYMMSGVVKYDLESEQVVASVELPSPDNLYWDLDGNHLLVASHSASLLDQLACQDLTEGSCGYQFEIVRLNIEDMSSEVLFSQIGPPMGAATVAVPVADLLFLGTFAGDRIGIFQR